MKLSSLKNSIEYLINKVSKIELCTFSEKYYISSHSFNLFEY